MKKTISAVVAAGIISTAAMAQDAGTKAKQNAGQAKSQGIDHKQASEGKAATKPGTPSGTKTNNTEIKPARTEEKKSDFAIKEQGIPGQK